MGIVPGPRDGGNRLRSVKRHGVHRGEGHNTLAARLHADVLEVAERACPSGLQWVVLVEGAAGSDAECGERERAKGRHERVSAHPAGIPEARFGVAEHLHVESRHRILNPSTPARERRRRVLWNRG